MRRIVQNIGSRLHGGSAPAGGFSGDLLPPLLLVAAIGAALLGAVMVTGCGGGKEGTAAAEVTTVSGGLQTSQPTPEATIDPARPTGRVSGHLESLGPNDRIVIRKIGVNARLVHGDVPPDGVMPDPQGSDDVIYYDFSNFEGYGGAPGQGGNTVLAGHVDSGTAPCKNGTVPPPCEAVLWDLNTLRVGDVVELQIAGQVYRYSVATNQSVSAANGPWNQIMAATAEETVTIITCGGDFNRETHKYSDRQVVTAKKIT